MSKEHAYAYEAGYRDGSIHYELEHCPACKNVADLQEALEENAKLQDENARLRSCLSDDAENARMIMGKNAELREEVEQWHRLTAGIELPEYPITEFKPKDLERENAKLRELVARMAEALGIDCEWADPNWCKSPCVLEFGCWPESDHTEIRCPAWAIMSELGIEVDG